MLVRVNLGPVLVRWVRIRSLSARPSMRRVGGRCARRSHFRQACRDRGHGIIDGHMLPDSKDSPIIGSESGAHVSVPLHGRGDLRGPPVTIGLGCRCVDRANVPEAAVAEDGQTKAGERDVDRPPGVDDRSVMDTESESLSV